MSLGVCSARTGYCNSLALGAVISYLFFFHFIFVRGKTSANIKECIK